MSLKVIGYLIAFIIVVILLVVIIKICATIFWTIVNFLVDLFFMPFRWLRDKLSKRD